MEKKVEFKSGEETLRGSLIIPHGDGRFPAVIFFHGSRSDRVKGVLAGEELSKKGIMSLAFEFRGHGESSGEYEETTLKEYLEDGQAALDFLINQKVDKNRLGIKGSSLGGFVASALLLKNNIESLLLSVPAAFSNTSMTMPDSEAKGRDFLNTKENWKKSLAYEGIRNYEGKLLVVRNELDSLLSKEMVEGFYFEANKAKKRKLFVLKGAEHSTYDNPPAMEIQHNLTVNWFLETL